MRGAGGRNLSNDLSHLGGVVASVIEQLHGRVVVTGDAHGQFRWAAHRIRAAYVAAGGDPEDLKRLFGELARGES